MNHLKSNRKTTVMTLLLNKISQHEIHQKTGVDRKTIRAIARGMSQNSNSSMATGDGLDAIQIPPPRPPDGGASNVPVFARSACEPHREWIAKQVALGRNAKAIHEELVDQFGFTHAYNSVKRFCGGLKKTEPEQFDRLEFLPGEEAQVDYGEGALTLYPPVTD